MSKKEAPLFTKSEFAQSSRLKEIIDSHDWQLYDVSNPSKEGAYKWEELNKMRPAKKFVLDHNYMFVPKPCEGQTLRDAYAFTKGLGPSLTIENPDDDRWLSLQVQRKINGTVALFSRLFFYQECAVATSPKSYYLHDPDFVAVRYDKLIETFEKYFRIVKPEEYGLTAPVPMPQIM